MEEVQLISFVIPCYNSERSVSLVIQEIRDVVAQRPEYDYEVVAVNDCSPDHVLDVLIDEARADKRVKVIDLAKNGGRHNALMAGYHVAEGEFVVCVDDDCQCPLDRFWDLLAPLERGEADVAFAKYVKKQQSGLKNLGSWFNDVGSTWLMDKPKDLHFSNFAVMRRFIRDEVIRYDNPYAYVSGLMFRASSRVVNVTMEDRARTIGTSNYTLRKSIQLLVNSFTSFSIKPLRLATSVGVLCALIGFLYGVVIIIQRLVRPIYAAGYSSIMAGMLFIGGMIMIMLGIIGEYIGRIYICINKSPQYVVRKTYNVEKETPSEVH
ncbi:MAG: glycosyltransferase [Clostridiales bacterium]|nr:glycosyltransferase [Clostridiales bacterium]